MQRKKGFKMTEGVYYFNISGGYNNNITIFRNTREEAENAFSNYQKQHKECEWLGQWNGSKFIDSDFKKVA
jgi:hypothetical protein